MTFLCRNSLRPKQTFYKNYFVQPLLFWMLIRYTDTKPGIFQTKVIITPLYFISQYMCIYVYGGFEGIRKTRVRIVWCQRKLNARGFGIYLYKQDTTQRKTDEHRCHLYTSITDNTLLLTPKSLVHSCPLISVPQVCPYLIKPGK